MGLPLVRVNYYLFTSRGVCWVTCACRLHASALLPPFCARLRRVGAVNVE